MGGSQSRVVHEFVSTRSVSVIFLGGGAAAGSASRQGISKSGSTFVCPYVGSREMASAIELSTPFRYLISMSKAPRSILHRASLEFEKSVRFISHLRAAWSVWTANRLNSR